MAPLIHDSTEITEKHQHTEVAINQVDVIEVHEWNQIKEIYAFSDGSGGTPKAGDNEHATWAIVLLCCSMDP